MKIRIFLLALVLGCTLPAFIAQVMYIARRGICRIEFESGKSKIPSHAIQTIAFPMHAIIDWEKEGKEFVFHGKLYDVISIHKTALFMILECVPDVQEDHIVYAYVQYLQKSNSKSDQNPKSKIKNFKFFPVITEPLASQEFRQPKVIYSPVTGLITRTIEVYSPPPQNNYAI